MITTTTMPPAAFKRPNKPASDLAPDAKGHVRPYLRVQPETLSWLEERGAYASQRGAILVELLRSRYGLPVKRRPGIVVSPESTIPFRPLLPAALLDDIDAERRGRGWSRGQMVDAIVALARIRAGTRGPGRGRTTPAG